MRELADYCSLSGTYWQSSSSWADRKQRLGGEAVGVVDVVTLEAVEAVEAWEGGPNNTTDLFR